MMTSGLIRRAAIWGGVLGVAIGVSGGSSAQDGQAAQTGINALEKILK